MKIALRPARLWSSILLLPLLMTMGCHSLAPQKFAGSAPPFDPQTYFAGPVRSWGVFENRAGEPSQRFHTASDGRWEGGALLLDQEFTYEDGRKQQRHWRIVRVDAHRFEATANDVVGTARGEAYGNAFRWEYTVALKPGNPLYDVHLRQWMYLQADGRSMVNRATIRKLGVEVAEVTEFFRRDKGTAIITQH